MLAVISEDIETGIISRAKCGDCEAFEQLVIRYRSHVINFIFRMYGDENLAEDIAQTAFVQAWLHLASFEPRASFRSWLFRIAMNAALDHLRREKPVIDIDDVVLLSGNEKMDVLLENRERNLDIHRAVMELPDASRMVLVLKEYEGLRYHEIAETLEIPLGTVMSRLSYARKKLAEKLSVYLEEL